MALRMNIGLWPAALCGLAGPKRWTCTYKSGTKKSFPLTQNLNIDTCQSATMPRKSYTRKSVRTARQPDWMFSGNEIVRYPVTGSYPIDPSHHHEETALTEEKPKQLAHLYEVLKKTVTTRTVPFPLHVAFAENVAFEDRGVAPPRGPGSTVGFWEWEGDRYQWGIPLAQLAERRSRLAYPESLAFELGGLYQQSVRFELVWPGYLHRRWLVPVPLYDNFGEKIQWTKQELGGFIACQYRYFAELCTRNQIICKEPAWKIGSGGIAFDDMRIVSFWNITKDIWRAEITIDVPNNGWAKSRQEHYTLTGAEGCYSKIIPEGKDKSCPSCSTVHNPDPRFLCFEKTKLPGKKRSD